MHTFMSAAQQIQDLKALLETYENELQVTMPNFAQAILEIVPIRKVQKTKQIKADFYRNSSRHNNSSSPTVEVQLEECSLDLIDSAIENPKAKAHCNTCHEVHSMHFRLCDQCYEKHDGCCIITE